MVTELTAAEYRTTFGNKMYDVTETAIPVIDIWPYVELLVGNGIVLRYVFENELVERVYRNDEGTFDHILLPTKKADFFVVVIIDLKIGGIKGFYRLDVAKEYGL